MRYLIRAHLEDRSGYGQHVVHTARQLERLGHRVGFEALNEGERPPNFFRDRRAGPGPWDRVVQISPPFRPCPPGSVYCTTWESDSFPAPCAAHLEGAALVIVNSRFIRDAFERAGVRAPVRVVPLGVCPAEYYPTDEPPESCRFGVVANLKYSARRKNVAGAVAAFRRAFGATEAASLVIKIDRDDAFDDPGDPAITIVRERLSTAAMRRFYNSLTCLVSASMAEGFGLCPLQAMACGRPAIAATYGGHGEYLDESVGYPVAYDLVQPDWYEGGGNLALPSVRAMADCMRAAADDRRSAAAKGLAALARARDLSWDRYGERLTAAIDAGHPGAT